MYILNGTMVEGRGTSLWQRRRRIAIALAPMLIKVTRCFDLPSTFRPRAFRRTHVVPPFFASGRDDGLEVEAEDDSKFDAAVDRFSKVGSSNEPMATHSYVEGINFNDDAEAKILAMGGDPFFLKDEDNHTNESLPPDDRAGMDAGGPAHSYVEGLNFDGDQEAEILALGGDPFFLTDEDDHTSESLPPDGREGTDIEDDTMPSPSFLEMAGTLDVISKDFTERRDDGPEVAAEKEGPESFVTRDNKFNDPLLSASAMVEQFSKGDDVDDSMPTHSYVEGLNFNGDQEAEILALGGDPFFLEDEDGHTSESLPPDDCEGVNAVDDAVASLSFLEKIETLDIIGEGDIMERNPTDGLGPLEQKQVEVTQEAWDGWEIENAHFD